MVTQAQLRADPRIQAIVAQRRAGALSDAELRSLGYDVPDGYHYTFGGRAGNGTLMDNKQSWVEKGYPAMAAGAAAGGLAIAGAAGPGAVGGTTAMHAVPPAVTAAGTGGAVAATSAGFWSPSTLGLIGTGINAGTNLIGAKMASTAAGRAAALQQQANAESLAFLKEQDARDYAEYLKERDRLWGHEDVDRTRTEEDRQLKLLREREREGRLAPFREGAADGYKTLAGLLRPPVAGMVSYGPPVSNATTRGSLADLLRG